MTHSEKAVEYFRRGFLCSQAVLAAYAPEVGLTEKQALRLGACLGSGMTKGEVCGACSGALLVLGGLYGQYDKSDPQSRLTANSVADKMMRRFAEANSSYICNDLLGYDISTQEGAECARSCGLFTDFCPKMVASAAELLEKIIEEQENS